MGTETLFVGSVPEHYDRHLGPVLFEPMARDLARRVRVPDGARVIEVACGTGIGTRALLGVLPPHARLVATDLNAAMIEHARASVPADARLEWRVADANALGAEARTFDAWVCQLGVMFFPDKLAAFREARRVLVPGGTVRFNVFCEQAGNVFGRVAHETIGRFFAADPPAFYRVPFSWCDEATIRSTLAAAGFAAVAIERVDLPTSSESAAHFATGLVRGNPVVHEIHERSTNGVAAIEAALADALGAEGGVAPWRGVLRSLAVTAWA